MNSYQEIVNASTPEQRKLAALESLAESQAILAARAKIKTLLDVIRHVECKAKIDYNNTHDTLNITGFDADRSRAAMAASLELRAEVARLRSEIIGTGHAVETHDA